MSCTNTTSPIDIIKMNSKTCDLKCEYTFDYQITSVRAVNKGEYILYTFDKENTSPVIFNGDKYNVEGMRLYQPSLHSFNNRKTDAEILIIHNNIFTNKSLIVCVPIQNSSNGQSEIDILINQVSKMANNKNSITNLSLNNFSLKSLVPNKPYFYYQGTLPYIPCDGKINYLVYDINDSLKIMNNTYNNLKKIIKNNNINSIKGKQAFYNKDGPSNNNLGDDIYIDCQPTGDSGEILISKSIDNINFDPKLKKIILYTFYLLLFIVILYYLLKFLWFHVFSPLYNYRDICEGSNCD